MVLPDEVDLLVVQLAASLTPPSQRNAFIDAARTALADIPCLGPGSAYRVLAPLQRGFFDPPSDGRTANAGARHHAPNRLNSLPPIDVVENPQGAARRRTLWAKG
jgi:hypothetical protein